jgi:hypothetical protein
MSIATRLSRARHLELGHRVLFDDSRTLAVVESIDRH